jgi:uncharacterized protein GlcG (DUF336 family)
MAAANKPSGRKSMIRRHAFAGIAACLVSLAIGDACAADSLPTETHKFLTSALAVEAAQAAIASCKAQGWTVSVTITDRSGSPILVLMGDGARALTKEVTRRKAYTSALLGISTADFAQRVATPGAFNPAIYDPQLAMGPGGLPIKVDNDTIGGIAAAGAPGGDKDEACAAAGLAKISDRLK